MSLYTIPELIQRLEALDFDDSQLADGQVVYEAAQALRRSQSLLRQWQYDVGGASERLERETLAEIHDGPSSSGHPSGEPRK